MPGVLVAMLSSIEQGVRDPSYRTLVIVANSRQSTFTLDWPAGRLQLQMSVRGQPSQSRGQGQDTVEACRL